MYLELRNITKTFGEEDNKTYALRKVSFNVDKGQFVVILGPSGSGKSTLLNIIGGIENADSGTIVIDGDELESFGDKKLTEYRRKHAQGGCVMAIGIVKTKFGKVSGLECMEPKYAGITRFKGVRYGGDKRKKTAAMAAAAGLADSEELADRSPDDEWYKPQTDGLYDSRAQTHFPRSTVHEPRPRSVPILPTSDSDAA